MTEVEKMVAKSKRGVAASNAVTAPWLPPQ